MQVRNHLLYDGSQVKFVETPHISKGVKDIRFIVIHYTAASTFMSGVWWHADPRSKVSADLHLGREGELIQMARFNQITWHAGASSYKGYNSLNKYSIGIELQNTGTQEYPKIQLDVLVEICKALVKAYPNIQEIVGHDMIAIPKGRKTDPGKQFPMIWLNEQVFSNRQISKSTTANLNLRLEPNTASDILVTIPNKTQLSILSEDSDWSKVVYGGKTGWVSNKYLK